MSSVAAGKEPVFLQVERAFLDKLLRESFGGGQPLKESLLAREFGVSRPVMREVLCQAVGWGIVEYVAFSGFRIKDFTIREMFDWYDMRLAVEPLAARRIVESGNPAAIKSITDCHERERAALEAGDNNAFAVANIELHRTILTATGNTRFCNLAVLALFAVVFNFERGVVHEIGYLTKSSKRRESGDYINSFLCEQNLITFRYSEEVAAALNSGSPERAEEVLRRYVEGIIIDRQRDYSLFGDWNEPLSLFIARYRALNGETKTPAVRKNKKSGVASAITTTTI